MGRSATAKKKIKKNIYIYNVKRPFRLIPLVGNYFAKLKLNKIQRMNKIIQFRNIFPTSLLFEILEIKASEQATVITGCERLWSTHIALKPRTRFYALRFSLLKSSYLFLDAFAKLRKVSFSFVMAVRRSVRMEQLGSHWTDFHEI